MTKIVIVQNKLGLSYLGFDNTKMRIINPTQLKSI